MDMESNCRWELLFSELDKYEDLLETTFKNMGEALNVPKFSKINYKIDEWRNLHNNLSKNGKVVEKLYLGYNFEESLAKKSCNDMIWKRAIFETLIREGFTLNSFYPEEAEHHSKAYAQLSKFIGDFDADSYSIFEWIKNNFPDSPEKENLLVEFTQYLFFNNLHKSDTQGALVLIRDHIKYFKNPENQKMINKLLTKCLYMNPADSQSLHENSEQLGNLKDHFVKCYCKFERIPKSDPLTVCNEIGTKSIPPLDRLNSLLKSKNNTSLGPDEELPIELPVEEEQVFHSIFCCPVIKQQSSFENPAYLLPCSHALSKEALNKLSKGNSLVRFKCPYCPSETNMSNCLQLHF